MDAKPAAASDLDAVLMLAAREGDQEAYRELFQRHAAKMVGYADRFFRNRAVSEELAQEIFIRVWRARKRYEPRSKFTTWLYTIASRACLNELRKRRHRQPEELLDEARSGEGRTGPPAPDQALEGARMQTVIERCLADMPANQRHALVLTRFGGHSYAEAAGLLGLSESAVKSLIFRATAALRAVVGEQAAGGRAPGSRAGRKDEGVAG